MKTTNKQKNEVTDNLDQMESFGDKSRIWDLIFQKYKYIFINGTGRNKEILFDLQEDANGSHIPIILICSFSRKENPINGFDSNGERYLVIQFKHEKGTDLRFLNQGDAEKLARQIANNWVSNIFPLIIGS